MDGFKDILWKVTFIAEETNTDREELEQLKTVCREYIIGLSIKIEQNNNQDKARNLALAIYFSSCGLLPGHRKLATKDAFKLATKLKALQTAYHLARQYLDFDISAEDQAYVFFNNVTANI